MARAALRARPAPHQLAPPNPPHPKFSPVEAIPASPITKTASPFTAPHVCAASPKISRIPLAPDPSRLSSRATCQPHPTTKSLHRHSYKMRTAAKTAPQSRENLPPARHCEIAISHPSRSLKSPSPPRADSLLTTNNQLAMSTPTIANANSDRKRDIYKPGEARPTYTRAPRKRRPRPRRPPPAAAVEAEALLDLEPLVADGSGSA